MGLDLVGGFLQKKKADSPFLSLVDGESVSVKRLRDIKLVTKSGFGGEPKEVLSLKCEVDTSEGERDKNFENGTAKFAAELQEKGVVIGCSFTITRVGEGTKTRYTISDVVLPAPKAATPAAPKAPKA